MNTTPHTANPRSARTALATGARRNFCAAAAAGSLLLACALGSMLNDRAFAPNGESAGKTTGWSVMADTEYPVDLLHHKPSH